MQQIKRFSCTMSENDAEINSSVPIFAFQGELLHWQWAYLLI